MRVLIDAAYRSQTLGTGISTYSRTLGRELTRIGHDVLWLSGAHAPARSDALMDAVYAADDPPSLVGPRRYLQTAKNMAAGLIRGQITARRLQHENAVSSRDPTQPPSATLLAPDVFVHAHYRHMLIRQFCDVKTSEAIDVLHLTAPLPIKLIGAKMVVTIHDLVPVKLPYTTTDNKGEFLARVRTSAALADLIVTVSESSKRDIVELLGVTPDKVAVTYQSSDIAILDREERGRLETTLRRFGLTDQQFVLFVGAIEPKKNLRRLVDAFLDADDSLPLVVVGPRAWKWEQEIGDLDSRLGELSRKRIRILGHVSRDDLRALYSGAIALCFPSLHEGFGLPVLEAMRMGCSVLSSNAGGLSEVAGGATLLVDPYSHDSIRDGITRIIADTDLRDSLRMRGLAQAETFSETAYRDRLAAAYTRLA